MKNTELVCSERLFSLTLFRAVEHFANHHNNYLTILSRLEEGEYLMQQQCISPVRKNCNVPAQWTEVRQLICTHQRTLRIWYQTNLPRLSFRLDWSVGFLKKQQVTGSEKQF